MDRRELVCVIFLVFILYRAVCEELLYGSSAHRGDGNEDPIVSRISFGSCANQSAPQPIWNAVLAYNPELFIWLGDNIYADGKLPISFTGKARTHGPWKNTKRFWSVPAEEMAHKYEIAKSKPGYETLRKRAKVVGTWDDHDYGLNDAGREFSQKEISQKLMLDFLDEPLDSLRRQQKGVYTSYIYGPIGKQLKVILLDTRYHRDPLFSNGTMLGETQWAWLEQQLKSSKAQINIIASSIQVIPNATAFVQPFFNVESWSNFPSEKARLLKLIAEANVGGVIFISGDVHFCEISRYDCAAVGYPLYDVTSSGITQAVEQLAGAPFSYIMRIAAWLIPVTMRVYNPQCRYKSCIYGKQNFGTIEINWDTDPVLINMQVRDVEGKPVTGTNVSLADLQPGSIQRDILQAANVREHCTLEADLPWIQRYTLAFWFFGSILVLITASLVMMHYILKTIGNRRQVWIQKRKPE